MSHFTIIENPCLQLWSCLFWAHLSPLCQRNVFSILIFSRLLMPTYNTNCFWPPLCPQWPVISKLANQRNLSPPWRSLLSTLQFFSPQLLQTLPPHLVLSSLPVTFLFVKHWHSPGSPPMVSPRPLPTSLLTAPQSIVSLPDSGAGVNEASCFISIFIWMFGIIWISNNRPQNEVILFLAPTWFLNFLSL